MSLSSSVVFQSASMVVSTWLEKRGLDVTLSVSEEECV
mgnify:CR=1 FL=1